MKRKISRAEKSILGRITTMRAHWVYGDHGDFTREQNGKQITLIGKRGLVCKNQKWRDEKPANDNNNGWWVPSTECRKCKHYEKSGRTFNFPRCLWKARAHSPGNAAIEVMKERAKIFKGAMHTFGKFTGGDS